MSRQSFNYLDNSLLDRFPARLRNIAMKTLFVVAGEECCSDIKVMQMPYK
ncbi:MAG: hypothetical protein LLG13_15125 [Bacteroidales bacterium]|nr:hypothetical protein [Bacteroidales bacterium]